MAKDFYLRPDAPDPILSAETVLSIVHRHVHDAKTVTSIDEGGGEARTYGIDATLILKIQRPHRARARTSLVKERFLLEALAAVDGVRVPRVLGGGFLEPDVAYTLMTRLPGVAMESALIDDNTSKQALFDLGRMLRRLHSVPQQALLDARLIPGDHTPTDVHMRFGNLFNDAVTALGDIDPSEAVQKDLHSLARLALRALPNDFECVALHSNPGLEHVFVDSDSGQLTGIIDFGDAYFSHPVFDLRRMRSAADRSSIYRGYTADQAVSEDFQTAWRVSCALTEMQKLVRDSKSVAGLQEAWSALSGDAFATF